MVQSRLIALGCAFAALGACSAPQAQSDAPASLDDIIKAEANPQYTVPGAALAVAVSGEIVWTEVAGTAHFGDDQLTPETALTSKTRVRAASMSKLVTALTAYELAQQGVVDLDENILPILGYDPRGDGASISLRQLFAHTSGVCDPEVYWAPLGARLAALFEQPSPCDYAPDGGWTYANINFGLAAEVMEHRTGERFDQLASRLVLEPAGLSARFNWSEMDADEKMSNGGSLFRWIDGVWQVQIDGRESLQDPEPSILRQDDRPLEAYEPGSNGTLFSPQGGLRASVEELAILSGLFRPDRAGAELAVPVWTGLVDPGVTAWGTGPQILIPGQIPGYPELSLVGHSGEAYGLYGGTWSFTECPVSFAFFVNGTDPTADASRDLVTGQTYWEDQLLRRVMPVALSYCDTE